MSRKFQRQVTQEEMRNRLEAKLNANCVSARIEERSGGDIDLLEPMLVRPGEISLYWDKYDDSSYSYHLLDVRYVRFSEALCHVKGRPVERFASAHAVECHDPIEDLAISLEAETSATTFKAFLESARVLVFDIDFVDICFEDFEHSERDELCYCIDRAFALLETDKVWVSGETVNLDLNKLTALSPVNNSYYSTNSGHHLSVAFSSRDAIHWSANHAK